MFKRFIFMIYYSKMANFIWGFQSTTFLFMNLFRPFSIPNKPYIREILVQIFVSLARPVRSPSSFKQTGKRTDVRSA